MPAPHHIPHNNQRRLGDLMVGGGLGKGTHRAPEHLLVWHTESGNAETWGSLKEAEKSLPQDAFSRCNHSCVVSLSHVADITGDRVTLRDGTQLAVSHSKKKNFMARYTALCGGKGK